MAEPKQKKESKDVKFLKAQIGKYVTINLPHSKYTKGKLVDFNQRNLTLYIEDEDGAVEMIPFRSNHIYYIRFSKSEEE